MLAARARRLTLGHAMDPGAFLGPLATAKGLEKFLAMQAAAERQALGDARQIANPVGIAVDIAARVDLVDHAAAPPAVVGCRFGNCLHGWVVEIEG